LYLCVNSNLVAQDSLFDELDQAVTPGDDSEMTEEEEFREFVEGRNAEYEAYREQLLSEFETFKKIVTEERSKYQTKVGSRWDQAELSTNKVWVEYSEDLDERRRVDFENETITIEVKGNNQSGSDSEVREKLKTLLTKNKQEAFEDDKISSAVEVRSQETIENLVTAEVPPEPILMPYLTGKQTSSEEEVDEIVDNMMAQVVVTESKDSSGELVTRVEVPLTAGPEVEVSPEPQASKAPAPDTTVAGKTLVPLDKKAASVSPDVSRYAGVAKVEQALVFAIIETESDFFPMAASPIPAYGLMQIVPRSAGMDATEQLFGKAKVLSPAYLYDSSRNIEIGTTYLNILLYRYLKAVSDPVSRMYCSIAAYNTGSGNVAMAFVGRKNVNAAAKVINEMTPQEVYDHLRKNLPYEETRNYIERVTKRIQKYDQSVGAGATL